MKYLTNMPELELLARALEYTGPGLRVSSRVEAYSVKPVARERQLLKRIEASLQAEIDLATSISPPSGSEGRLFANGGGGGGGGGMSAGSAGSSAGAVGSAFGPLDLRASRKTFWLLIATLNLAFPDHDFQAVRPDEFVREPSASAVLASLSSALSHLRSTGGISTSGSSAGNGGLSNSTGGPGMRAFSGYPASPPKVSVPLPGAHPHSAGSASSPDNNNHQYDAAMHPFFREVLDPIIDLADCEVYSYQPEIDSDPHADEDGSLNGDYFDDDNDLDGYLDDDVIMDDDARSDDTAWPMDDLPYAPVPTPPFTSSRPGSAASHRRTRSGRSSGAPSPFGHAPKRSLSTLSIASDPDPSNGGSPYYPAGRSTGGLLWSCNYFMYSKSSKRVLFISLWARTKSHFAPIPPSPVTVQPVHTQPRLHASRHDQNHHHKQDKEQHRGARPIPGISNASANVSANLRPRAAPPVASSASSTGTFVAPTQPMRKRARV